MGTCLREKLPKGAVFRKNHGLEERSEGGAGSKEVAQWVETKRVPPQEVH